MLCWFVIWLLVKYWLFCVDCLLIDYLLVVGGLLAVLLALINSIEFDLCLILLFDISLFDCLVVVCWLVCFVLVCWFLIVCNCRNAVLVLYCFAWGCLVVFVVGRVWMFVYFILWWLAWFMMLLMDWLFIVWCLDLWFLCCVWLLFCGLILGCYGFGCVLLGCLGLADRVVCFKFFWFLVWALILFTI